MKRLETYLIFVLCTFYNLSAESVDDSAYNLYADTVMNLPQVSVTAVKIGTQLRSKPVSATVIDASEIKRDRIVNMHQVSDLSPNLYIPRYGSRITSSVYMRGIGARIDQPAVGLTIDNIPILNKDNYDFDVDDMVRVDIVRGPQNTMFGRNTMCGLININTLSPLQFDGVRVTAELGSYDTYRATVGAYHIHSENIGVAVGGSAGGSTGYYRNTYNGCRVGGEKNWNAWYKLEWHPGHDLSIENSGRFYHSQQSGYPYELLGSGTIAYNDTCFYKRNSWLDGLTVSWKHDAWNLTSVTSVQHIDDNMTLDQDFLPLNYFTLTQRRRETSVTQDFIVSHNTDRYTWLFGLFGFTRHSNMHAPVTFGAVGIENLIENKRNENNPSYPIKWNESSFVLNSDFMHPTRGLGVYHNSTFNIGRWVLTGAVRLDIERPMLDYHSYTNTGYTIWNNTDPANPEIFRNVPVSLDETGCLSHTYVEQLPKLTALYKLPRVSGNVYGSVSKGYKPGGYNTQMFSDFLQQKLMASMGLTELYDADEIIGYKPERSWNYEIGTHLTLLGGDMSIDAAVFYIDCRDQQLTRFPDGTTTGRIMDNAGRTRSVGSEIALRYSIDSHWSTNMSWGHADARFVEYNDGINDYSGNFVPYAPLNTLYGQVVYATSLPGCGIDRLEVMAGVRGTGNIYWNELNSQRQNFYAPVNIAASVRTRMFTVRLWAENINKVKYSTFYFKSMGNEFVQRGAPFTFGVSVNMELDLDMQ